MFQKNNIGNGSTTVTATTSGAKKTKIASNSANNNNMSLCPEPSSPFFRYLPPLLDSSPYTDLQEHVPCFSTTSTTSNVVSVHNNFSNNNNGSFHLVSLSMDTTIDPLARFQRNVGVSAFPSLGSSAKLRSFFFFSRFRSGGFGRDGGGSVVVGVCVGAATEIVEFGGGHGGGLNDDDDEDIFPFF